MATINNKTLIASALVTALMVAPVTQASEHNNSEQQTSSLSPENKEEIGFGTGALIGGIFGGPVGAMITGVAGTFIMKHINSEDEVDELSQQLTQEKQQYSQELISLQKQIQRNEQDYQQELLALSQQQGAAGQLQAKNLLMSLQFKTGSSDIPDHYQEQLTALGEILKQSPDLTVDLSGYTDLLGNSELNMKLSQARANAVKTSLIDLGIDATRINTQGFGDLAPVVANAQQESSFYDRRVMIKLISPITQVANNY